MTPKEELIQKLIDSPEDFTDKELNALINDKTFTAKDLRKILLRLFDQNDEVITNDSTAHLNRLGKLNRKSMAKREKLFWKKIKRGNLTKRILVEGDSWFEYPKFITEIVDHLNKRKDYAIFSMAYGGDWITNILFEHTYIEKLSLIKPEVFLISGGGNDIVGGSRLAQLVKKRTDLADVSNLDLSTKEGKIAFSNLAFNSEFFALLKVFKIQYILLFESIKKNTDKFNDLKIITQGYDYAIPSSSKGFGWNPFKLMRPISNWIIGNGKWLKTPLLLREYRNKKERIAVIYGMIEFFNEMIIEAGKNYDNVYHIDSRGAVHPKKGWYNELHPKSNQFKKIAKVYEACIDAKNNTKKVYRVQ